MIAYWLNGGNVQFSKPVKNSVCDKNLSKVVDQKIKLDILMGCATVNGSRVSSEKELQKLYKKGQKPTPPTE